MTRGEAKAVLIALKKAIRQISDDARRIAELGRRLDEEPCVGGAPPETITLVHTVDGRKISESAYSYPPRAHSTSDPTFRIVSLRDTLSNELQGLAAEINECEDFLLEVTHALSTLPSACERVLHLHYCLGVKERFATPAEKANYFYRLRCAVTAFQRLSDTPPPIPEALRKEEY